MRRILSMSLIVAALAAAQGCDASGLTQSTDPIPPLTSNDRSSTTSTPTSTSNTSQPSEVAGVSPHELRLAFVGDTGTGGEQQYQVARLIESEDDTVNFDRLVLLGDMIYESGDPALIDSVVLKPYSGTLDDGTELVPVLGNHDVRMGAGDEIMAALGAPHRWYSVGDDRLLLVVLDSTRPDDPDQLKFLTNALATARSDWVVVALHHPPFSAGFHGSTSIVQETFVPVFEQYDVDVVFAGHDHDYQRSHPIAGTTYVVTGGGAKLRPTGTLDFTAVSISVAHFVSLEVRSGSLTIESISLDGVVDKVILTK